MLYKRIFQSVVSTGLFFICLNANANLIVNGGFEATDVADGRWAWFSSDFVDGWSGSNIEIWDSLQKFESYEGEQHAELNSHPSDGGAFSIFQSFETQIGTAYDVSFAYSARSNTNEAFLFELTSEDMSIYASIIDDHEVKTWFTFNMSFVAIDVLTTISFTSVTPYARTVGNFLDDISVTAQYSLQALRAVQEASAVPEPFSLLVFVIASVFLLVSQSRFRPAIRRISSP